MQILQRFLDAAAIKDYKLGLHQFLNLKEKILYLSLRDPSEYIEFPISEGFVNVSTKSGKQKVSVLFFYPIDSIGKVSSRTFMEVVHSFKVDFFECLSVDVPH